MILEFAGGKSRPITCDLAGERIKTEFNRAAILEVRHVAPDFQSRSVVLQVQGVKEMGYLRLTLPDRQLWIPLESTDSRFLVKQEGDALTIEFLAQGKKLLRPGTRIWFKER